MKFDYNKFFNIGEELSLKEDETYLRSAISRYYYCVFGLS